jgi:hypothetical protein
MVAADSEVHREELVGVGTKEEEVSEVIRRSKEQEEKEQ